MRISLIILFLSIAQVLLAQQPDAGGLYHAMTDLDGALVTRDSMELKWLLSDKVSYGHSNGWVETKRDVIADLFNGKLAYKQIKPSSPNIVIDGDKATARFTADVDVLFDGKPIQLKLYILQVWLWEKEHWVLWARQGAKL